MLVGAGLLALIAALALSVSGRKGNPPSWWARGIALACAASLLLIGWWLHSKTADLLYAEFVEGPGWTWMMAGGGMVTGAAIGALGLKAKRKRQAQKKRRRR